MEQHKAETLKYHPDAYAENFEGVSWCVWVDKQPRPLPLALNKKTEADAWESAALNAARMS